MSDRLTVLLELRSDFPEHDEDRVIARIREWLLAESLPFIAIKLESGASAGEQTRPALGYCLCGLPASGIRKFLEEGYSVPVCERHQVLVAAGEQTLAPPVAKITYDLVAHLHRQREFSAKTFGPGVRTAGVLDHIRKELNEIEANPEDLSEWIDLMLLAFDGAWRRGYAPETIADALFTKQEKNERRTWPDWRTQPADQAIEHVREAGRPGAPPAPLTPDWKEISAERMKGWQEATKAAHIAEATVAAHVDVADLLDRYATSAYPPSRDVLADLAGQLRGKK